MKISTQKILIECLMLQVVSMFRGCKTEDTPPHIYSMSQAAYRSMIATKRDQSIGKLSSGSNLFITESHVIT